MTTPRLIAVIAYAGGNLIDIAGPLQAFATANEIAGEMTGATSYQLVTVSEMGGPITTAPGLTLATEPLACLDERQIDTLIVPGGLPRSEDFGLATLTAWLRENADRPRRICSVCTGAFLLADAGVLEGKHITTHWARADELARRHPGLHIDRNAIFVGDGRLWTSGGVTAGIDLALALIEADLGKDIAIATARQLVVFVKRPGGQSQFSAPLNWKPAYDGRFAELHTWMAAHLDCSLTVEELAEQTNMSARSFARIYVKEIGKTPAKAVEMLRLEAACRALTETELPLKRIAENVGLGGEQNLRRVFQRQFGVGPADYRDRFATVRTNIPVA